MNASAENIFPGSAIHPLVWPDERTRKTLEAGLSIMHPGPITAALRSTAMWPTDCKRHFDQVTNGLAVRMLFFISAEGFQLNECNDYSQRSSNRSRETSGMKSATSTSAMEDRSPPKSEIRSRIRNEEINAKGSIVAPGLIDVHVHLREPGFSQKETIQSGGVRGRCRRIYTVVCMPNTSPVADNPSTIAWIKNRAAAVGVRECFANQRDFKKIWPAKNSRRSAHSRRRAWLRSRTTATVFKHEVMGRAVEYARMVDLPVLDHCQDYNLVGNGVVHEAIGATLLGFPDGPRQARKRWSCAIFCSRNFAIITFIASTSRPPTVVRLLREARTRGVKISGEVSRIISR